MCKILQAKFQQYVHQEIPDIQAEVWRGRGTRDHIADIPWHCSSLALEWKLTFSSPLATLEFSKFVDILSAAFNSTLSACKLSHNWLCNTMECSPPGSAIHGFSRQAYWSGSPFPPPGNLPYWRTEPSSPASPVFAGRFLTAEPPI